MPWRILGAARASVGGSGYNIGVAEPGRDEFPNNYVGDLVHTEHGPPAVKDDVPPSGM